MISSGNNKIDFRREAGKYLKRLLRCAIAFIVWMIRATMTLLTYILHCLNILWTYIVKGSIYFWLWLKWATPIAYKWLKRASKIVAKWICFAAGVVARNAVALGQHVKRLYLSLYIKYRRKGFRGLWSDVEVATRRTVNQYMDEGQASAVVETYENASEYSERSVLHDKTDAIKDKVDTFLGKMFNDK